MIASYEVSTIEPSVTLLTSSGRKVDYKRYELGLSSIAAPYQLWLADNDAVKVVLPLAGTSPWSTLRLKFARYCR